MAKMKYYDESTSQWIALDAKNAEAITDGSNLITPQDVVNISNKLDSHTNDANIHFTSTERTKLSGISDNANYYILPDATATTIGGVKVGDNLTITSGTVSAENASTTVKGVVQLNDTLTSTSTTLATTANQAKVLKDLVDTKADITDLEQKAKKYWLDITEFGAVKDSDSSDAIQAAINTANTGDVVFIPNGTFILNKTIQLKSGLKIYGAASSSVLKMKDGANLPQMLYLPPNSTDYNFAIELYNFQLDGNKVNNPTGGHGILLNTTYKAFVKDVKVSNVKGKGIYFSGNAQRNTNTNYVKDCVVYGCDEEGVYFDQYCSDMHIYGGDYGSSLKENIKLESPSSSVRTSTIWGSRQSSGLTIANNTPSVQIIANQIEGNAKHGVEVHASHVFITSNKIYDNSEFGNADLYSGIFLSSTHQENAAILDNTIFSGLYAGSGRHKHAIEFQSTTHKGASIFGNSMRYMGYGQMDLSRAIVHNLNLSEDQTDYSWVNTFFNAHLSTEQIIPASGWTKLQFDGIGRNADNEFNITNNTFVASQTAFYQFDAHATFQNAVDQDLMLMEFWVNGGAVKYRVHAEKTGGNEWYMVKGTLSIPLAKGDSISVHIFTNSGGKLFNSITHSRFTGKVTR